MFSLILSPHELFHERATRMFYFRKLPVKNYSYYSHWICVCSEELETALLRLKPERFADILTCACTTDVVLVCFSFVFIETSLKYTFRALSHHMNHESKLFSEFH